MALLRTRCHVDTLACKTIAQNVIVVRRTVTLIYIFRRKKNVYYLLCSIYNNNKFPRKETIFNKLSSKGEKK